jgi:hypothetical protein
MKHQGGWIGGAITLAKIGLLIAVATGIFYGGRHWEESIWQPIYNDLAKAYDDYRNDTLYKSAMATGKTNVKSVELKSISEVTDETSARLQMEVDRRVDDYLNKLSAAKLREREDNLPAVGDDPGIMPLSTAVASCPDNGAGLHSRLHPFEIELVHKILRTRDAAITRNIECKAYLDTVEAEMIPIRAAYKAALEKIKASQPEEKATD